MRIRFSQTIVKRLSVAAIVVILVAAWSLRSHWLPAARALISETTAVEDPTSSEAEGDHDVHRHGDHDHGHAGHDEANSIHLSEQARRNIGLTDDQLKPTELRSFTRTLDIPARVVERPGRTKIQVTAPMTGVVTAVHALEGEAVLPGTLLFKVRLTHEDLVQAQTKFLQTLGELDVEKREIARLKNLDKRGVIAGKTLLEREYSKQKLEAVLSAHREALLLHGLSSEQIDGIVRIRHLLGELEVSAPKLHPHDPAGHRRATAIEPVSATDTGSTDAAASHPFMVQRVNVQTGTMVHAGDPLCVLADLGELYIEGRAFEHDADEVTQAARMQAAGETDWGITAVPENNGDADAVENLKIVYVENEVDLESRALRFFVRLPNRVVHETEGENGHRFLTWRFKPGQRMQLQVPVERWEERIVLPVDAVAQEGAEQYVFQQNGDHFDRIAVHVEFQNQFSVVIANDGSLFPGDVVALTGAHQMQMAIKNKAGGGVDPHAGHHH